MLFDQQRRGPTTTVPRSADERKSALTRALSLLPASWRRVALLAEWCGTFDAPHGIRRLLTRDAEAVVFVEADQKWGVFTDSLDTEALLRLAMFVILRQIAVPESFIDPIALVMETARRTGATLDADGIAKRYSSMASPVTFAATLLSQTLTEPDFDVAHPLLHPAAEQLWPGSSNTILNAERILTTRCEALLRGDEITPPRGYDLDGEDDEDE